MEIINVGDAQKILLCKQVKESTEFFVASTTKNFYN